MALRSVLVAALLASVGCYAQDSSYAQPQYPDQAEVYGPPGGAMDPPPGQGDGTTEYPGYPQGYPDGSPPPGTELGAAEATATEPSADPADPGYAMGAVTDTEIDVTLEGQGEWIELDGYGRVWRPYATVVGADFTPYETCGSWVWTDWGWTYACDDYDWGWLAFHYGRWGWFDDYWAWLPDYEWGPGWVDWRSGGGYVGWRPQEPMYGTAGTVRDHRGEHVGPTIHDHRMSRTTDSQWRFAATGDLGKPHIRAHLYKGLAEGLRVTSPVVRPPRGTVQPIQVASIMRGRIAATERQRQAAAGGATTVRGGPQSVTRPPYQPPYQPGTYQPGAYQPGAYRPGAVQPGVRTSGYQPPPAGYQPPRAGWSRGGGSYSPPNGTSSPPVVHGGWTSPSRSVGTPSRSGGSAWGGGHSSSSGGGSSWGGGSHSSGGGGRSWGGSSSGSSGSSHSSGGGGGGHSSGGGGGGHASGGGGHSSGGGGGGHSSGGGGHRR